MHWPGWHLQRKNFLPSTFYLKRHAQWALHEIQKQKERHNLTPIYNYSVTSRQKTISILHRKATLKSESHRKASLATRSTKTDCQLHWTDSHTARITVLWTENSWVLIVFKHFPTLIVPSHHVLRQTSEGHYSLQSSCSKQSRFKSSQHAGNVYFTSVLSFIFMHQI